MNLDLDAIERAAVSAAVIADLLACSKCALDLPAKHRRADLSGSIGFVYCDVPGVDPAGVNLMMLTGPMAGQQIKAPLRYVSTRPMCGRCERSSECNDPAMVRCSLVGVLVEQGHHCQQFAPRTKAPAVGAKP